MVVSYPPPMVFPRLRSFLRLLCSVGLFLDGVSAFANQPPEVLAAGSKAVLRRGAAVQEIDLRTLFRDPDVLGSAVRVSVRVGTVTKTVDLALFDQQKPVTVANFLAYVNAGRYANNFFHRSVPGFVVQGGGFAWNSSDAVQGVPAYAKILNEPGISNLRGTVAMAKLGSDANSATSQWFVNLADNSANLDAQNGGFTVFGRVLGDGMAVMDEVAALPRVNAGSPFDSLPLKDYTGGSITRVCTVETNAAPVATLSFTGSSGDPGLVGASISGSKLQLTPAADRTGSTTVSLIATDLEGATAETTVSVDVWAPVSWHAENGADGEPAALVVTPGAGAVAANPLPVHFGDVDFGKSASRTLSIRNEDQIPLKDFTLTVTGANGADFVITAGANPGSVAAGASASFSVTFTPGTGGARSAILHLTTTDPGQGALDLSLSGTGVDLSPPTLSAFAPQTLAARVTRNAVVPDWRGTLVVASDNAGVVAFTQTPAPGTVLPIGTYPLVFSASDAAGNLKSAEGTLTVAYDPATLAQISLLPGARTGAPLPTTGSIGIPSDSTVLAFATPAISDTGTLAARVTIKAGLSILAGIYSENRSGQTQLVARQNQPSGVPNSEFKSFRDPLLSPSGKIAFAATLRGLPPLTDEGVWTDLFGSLVPVLREGSPVPGLGALKLKSVTSLSLSDDAVLALVKLVPLPGLVTAANDTALVRITGAGVGQLLARTGAGFQGSFIKRVSVLQPAPGSPGQGRWSGAAHTLAKLALANGKSAVVRIENAGPQIQLLQTGQGDPGVKLSGLSLPAMGGEGVAVQATLAIQAGVSAANDHVLLYAGEGTSFSEAVREEAGPGKFAGFSDPVLNDQGEMLFFGTQRPSGVPGALKVSALWSSGGTAPPKIVARVGAPAPDTDGVPLADSVWSAFSSFALPDGIGAGPVFIGTMRGPAVTAQNKRGLWAVDSGGALRLLLRTGSDIQGLAGTKRLTEFTLLNALPGSFGARRSYNATGSLAVLATFSDRSQALLRVDVP